MSPNQKNKNNHFVPQSYLERFHSVSDRQVALYNLKSGRTIETAPIKTQCSRDYFYTRNPIFEDRFSEIEGRQKRLFAEIITKESVPATGSIERSALSTSIMFREGRTVTAVQKSDHLTNQFGKAMLRARFEADGNTECPSGDFLIPSNHFDSMDAFLILDSRGAPAKRPSHSGRLGAGQFLRVARTRRSRFTGAVWLYKRLTTKIFFPEHARRRSRKH
jgi:hypothetical protein